jgi:hypothetical protein
MSKNASHKVFDGSALPGIAVLAERIIAMARRDQIQLVTVESCTAGAMAHALSRPFGAAMALAGGFVTYTKAAKQKLVGVPGRYSRNTPPCMKRWRRRWLSARLNAAERIARLPSPA